MKATVLAAAALLGGVSAQHNHHAHQVFHKRQNNDTGVVCSVVVETITGDFICMSSSQPALSFPRERSPSLSSPAFFPACPVPPPESHQEDLLPTNTAESPGTPTPDAQPANPDSTTTSYSTTTRTTTVSEAVTAAATSSADAVAVPTPAEQTLPTPGEFNHLELVRWLLLLMLIYVQVLTPSRRRL